MKDGEIEYLRKHLKEICDFKGLQGELNYDVPLIILQRVCFALDYLQKQNTELIEENERLQQKTNYLLEKNIPFVKELIEENQQLKDNWNKLKEWLEEEIKHLEKSRYVSFNEYGENKLRIYKEFLYKIQEIEGGMNE